jgi:hypothetical protein
MLKMKELVRKIIENISNEKEDSLLLDYDDKTLKIKEENFSKIKNIDSKKKVIFIDGGNLEIIKSPSLSLFFNRVYYTVYQNNKRIKSNPVEFYSLFSAINKEDKIFFKTDYFFTKGSLKIKNYEFDSFDDTIKTGQSRAQISSLGNVIRRFAELSLIDEIDVSDSIIILDGTLEAKYTYEKNILESIRKENEKKKNILSSVSKTTSLLTSSGDSAAAYLRKIAKEKSWIYSAGKVNHESHNADLYFVKLLPKSDYIFRLEASPDIKYNIDELSYLLMENSKDPVFYGYPYGLVEADRFARVSNKEKEMLTLILAGKLGKDFDKIKPYLNSMNAHDILDRVG